MRHMTIKEQENFIQASLTGAAFITVMATIFLLEEITLLWFGLTKISDAIGVSMLIPVLIYLVQMKKNPKMLSYGWRLRELCDEFDDEYLRSRFQSATTLAFQLMMFAALLGYIASDMVIQLGDPAWLSHKMLPFLVLFVGNLSFYLSLRNVLDVQDEVVEQSTKDRQ